MKFIVFPKTSSDTNQDTSNEERTSGSKTDISSNTDDIVHIADIFKATSRQFFEWFISVDFIILVVIPFTNKCARKYERGWSKVDKGPFQRKIPRKPHPIGCEFKTLANTQINLFLRLDPVEPSELVEQLSPIYGLVA
ncbi:6654_t:CDS:2 [Funneliformis caledonium]|uniref:6654_t:CDS:1 n=1 Tax=Funneliformis caledonium TaxID=1117310 RepID=A0A9N9NIC0_9GLOM|nr:6654_t:CDS:2 [Funneliformis caledonium]